MSFGQLAPSRTAFLGGMVWRTRCGLGRPVRVGPERIRALACGLVRVLVATSPISQQSGSPQDRLYRLEASSHPSSSSQDLFLSPLNHRYAHPCFPERRVTWFSRNTPVTLRSTSSPTLFPPTTTSNASSFGEFMSVRFSLGLRSV